MVAQLFNRAPQRARTATPLLAFIAGDFADAPGREEIVLRDAQTILYSLQRT